jgi:hypothetical protein
MFTVMGTPSEQLLARMVNAMRKARKENGIDGKPSEETAKQLSDALNDAEDYLTENEQFVDRLASRGDLS